MNPKSYQNPIKIKKMNKKQKIGIPIVYTYTKKGHDICSMKPINQNVKASIKTSTNLKNKTIMKTINLTLSGLTISDVLKSLHENALTPTYLGVDQNFNLLYKVSYNPEKEDIIKTTLKYIDDYDKMGREFEKAIDIKFAEVVLPIEEITFMKKPFKHMALKSFEKSFKKIENERAENQH
jgi:hypothetical protein